MYLTKSREILDFVRAVQGAQAAMPHAGLDQVIAETAAVLGVQTPSEIEYRAMLKTTAQTEAARKRSRGRSRSEAQTKSEAVAALVVYFESLGHRPGDALKGALRCMDVTLSRKVAYEAVTKYKAIATPDQYEILARMAYTTRWPGAKLIPPGMVKPRAKSKKNKSDRRESDLG